MLKTLLISGCTKGIGLAIVNKFAQMGFHIAGCARNPEDILNLQKKMEKQYPGQQFFFEVCDVSKKEWIQKFAQDALHNLGNIDVLINNAGTFAPGQIQNEEEDIFEKLMDTNISSAYHLTRAILPNMLHNKQGHIFNICSTASIKAYTNGGSYCISKYAMMGLNQVLREELKGKKIKVTAVLPGATLTHSWSQSDLPESRFIPATDIAKLVWSAYDLSESTNVEEILVRPVLGDID